MMPRVKAVSVSDEEILRQCAALEAQIFPDAWSIAAMRTAALAPATTLYAAMDENDNVLGYAFVTRVLDTADLDNIAVAPEYRRQGIAGMLLDAAFDGTEAAVHLEVRTSNAGAIALYRKHGFRECGIRKNYYQNPREDAVLMLRERESAC